MPAGALASTHAGARDEEPARPPLDPPRGASSASYRDAVANQRIVTDDPYLDPRVPLDAALPEEEPSGGAAFAEWPETIGTAVLALAVLAVLLITYRARHVLAEMFGRSDRQIRAPPVTGGSVGENGPIDLDFLDDLRQASDPRDGLRRMLGRFLALAAAENGMRLRRDLTTREIVRRLPGAWERRADLERLAGRVELTVFGGRLMSRAEYDECLALAAPHLRKVEAA